MKHYFPLVLILSPASPRQISSSTLNWYEDAEQVLFTPRGRQSREGGKFDYRSGFRRLRIASFSSALYPCKWVLWARKLEQVSDSTSCDNCPLIHSQWSSTIFVLFISPSYFSHVDHYLIVQSTSCDFSIETTMNIYIFCGGFAR